jgi:hypothetical protein
LSKRLLSGAAQTGALLAKTHAAERLMKRNCAMRWEYDESPVDSSLGVMAKLVSVRDSEPSKDISQLESWTSCTDASSSTPSARAARRFRPTAHAACRNSHGGTRADHRRACGDRLDAAGRVTTAPPGRPGAIGGAQAGTETGPEGGREAGDDRRAGVSQVGDRRRETRHGEPGTGSGAAAGQWSAVPAGRARRESCGTPTGVYGITRGDDPEPVRTLKCRECGTMNLPTEWYCVSCGAELAAL